MTDSPQQRHAELADEIRRHDRAYYVEAQPTVSDREYDQLYRELLDLEAAHPELRTPDSPSQRVGGEPIDGFETVRHAVPMMSLDNTYSQEEVHEFVERVQKLLPGESLDWVVEPKADGIAISLRYEEGSSPLVPPAAMALPAMTSRQICAPSAASRSDSSRLEKRMPPPCLRRAVR